MNEDHESSFRELDPSELSDVSGGMFYCSGGNFDISISAFGYTAGYAGGESGWRDWYFYENR